MRKSEKTNYAPKGANDRSYIEERMRVHSKRRKGIQGKSFRQAQSEQARRLKNRPKKKVKAASRRKGQSQAGMVVGLMAFLGVAVGGGGFVFKNSYDENQKRDAAYISEDIVSEMGQFGRVIKEINRQEKDIDSSLLTGKNLAANGYLKAEFYINEREEDRHWEIIGQNKIQVSGEGVNQYVCEWFQERGEQYEGMPTTYGCDQVRKDNGKLVNSVWAKNESWKPKPPKKKEESSFTRFRERKRSNS